MRVFSTPYLVDWFAITLRWFGLLGISFTIARNSDWLASALVFLWALVNIALAFMGSLNRRLEYHRQISVTLDFLFALALFLLRGGVTGDLWWAGALPLISAGLYFETKGSLLISLLISLLQAAGVFLFAPERLPWEGIGFAVFFNLLLGIVFGWLGNKLFAELRRLYQARQKAEQERRRLQNERLQAVYELTTTLTSTLSYRHVLESLLDLLPAALDPDNEQEIANQLVSAVLLFSEGMLTVGSARRFANSDWRVTLSGTQGLLNQVITDGEPLLVENFHNDPELRQFLILNTCRSLYLFPLRSGFDVYGVLFFAHPEAGFFTREKQELLEILGRQLVIAIKNARLYEDLLAEKEHLAEVQEEARNKLARDLHDGPTQTVSAIAMRLNFVRMLLERKPEAVPAELEKLEEMARRATKELRHMLFTLRPLVLETQGLTAALQAMAEKMRETYDQNVIIQVDPKMEEILDVGKKGVLFFIAEEAVNNARKHAQAEHIWVTLRDFGRDIALFEIKDDGVGFDIKSVMGSYETRGSLGMVNLRERTELVNGLLHLDSAPGKGTRVQVFVPLSEEAADRLHHAREV